MRNLLPLLFVSLGMTSCFVPHNAQPLVDTGVGVVSQYNFRGLPYDDKGALQGDVTVAMPTSRENGIVALNIFGNMALSNDNTGGVLGSDNSREFSRTDFTVSYTEPRENYDLTVGVTHYTFPGAGAPMMSMYSGYSYTGASTSQLFASASFDYLDLSPTIDIFFDFDAAGGFYINTHCSRTYEWRDTTWFEAGANLAFADGGYSEEYYGNDTTTVADLGARGGIVHQYNENTTLSANLNFSTLPDGALSNGLDMAGLDTTNVWLGLSAAWAW
ncbi:MAG: hypothetical protein ACI8QC_001769 [Planctomycetota bacterium]|jgi:hypothetical protein